MSKGTKKGKRENSLYWCYYPHTVRELVPPVCGIFFASSNRPTRVTLLLYFLTIPQSYHNKASYFSSLHTKKNRLSSFGLCIYKSIPRIFLGRPERSQGLLCKHSDSLITSVSHPLWKIFLLRYQAQTVWNGASSHIFLRIL